MLDRGGLLHVLVRPELDSIISTSKCSVTEWVTPGLTRLQCKQPHSFIIARVFKTMQGTNTKSQRLVELLIHL